MRFKYIIHSLLYAFVLLLTSCGETRPDESELLLLYSSDVMNYTLPYDFIHDEPSQVSLANFSSLVHEMREQYGEGCIVLDNGNKLLGTVPSGYYNYINTKEEPLAFRVERMIGYDAVGIGDKDFDLPMLLHPTRWNPALQPPMLCANLIDTETGNPVFTPYKVFERQGIRVAVLGLVSPDVLPWLPREEWQGVDIEDMIESARKWMPVIEDEHPDLVVGLFGSSLHYQDMGNTLDSYKNPNGSVPTAIRVPGFDVVLMGGTSSREVFEVRNDAGQYVTCVQTGSMATHCGEVRVEFSRNGDEYKKRISASIIDLKQYRPDPEYCRQLAGVEDTIKAWLHEPMGVLGDTLIGVEGFYRPDSYRQLIHRAQLWYSGADISMACCLIGTDTIYPGTLEPLSLFKLFPYANQLELVEMQGLEVVRYLEHASALQFETMKSPGDPLLALKRDANGDVKYNAAGHPCLAANPANFTSAAGIRYTIDVSKPAGQRVHVYSMSDGTPFDLRRTYKVAINSYQGKDRGQFFSKGLGWDRATIELHAVPRPQYSVRFAIQEYVRAMGDEPIHADPGELWQLVPKSLVEPAIQRELAQPLPVW